MNLLDRMKLRFVLFAYRRGWNYSVRLSSGTQLTRSSVAVTRDSIYFAESAGVYRLTPDGSFASLEAGDAVSSNDSN